MTRFAALLVALFFATTLVVAEDPTEKPTDVRLQQAGKALRAAAFSPDGARVAASIEDGALLRVWSAGDGTVVRSFGCAGSASSSPAFSVDGNRLAVGCGDGTVRAWEISSGKLLLEVKGHEHRVESVGFSPDSKRLASVAGADYVVKIWDMEGGREAAAFKNLDNAWNSVTWLPDGKRLLLAGGSVAVCDAETGKLLLKFSLAESCAALSPDGKRIATGTLERVMVAVEGQFTDAPHSVGQIWDVGTGKSAGDLDEDAEVREAPSALAWSGDGARVAMQRGSCSIAVYGAGEKPARLWTQPKAERAAILALRLSADGASVHLVLEGGLVRTWTLPKK